MNFMDTYISPQWTPANAVSGNDLLNNQNYQLFKEFDYDPSVAQWAFDQKLPNLNQSKSWFDKPFWGDLDPKTGMPVNGMLSDMIGWGQAGFDALKAFQDFNVGREQLSMLKLAQENAKEQSRLTKLSTQEALTNREARRQANLGLGAGDAYSRAQSISSDKMKTWGLA